MLAGDGHAPTNVRDPRLAVDVHLADSLAALELDVMAKAGRVADLGAGAGFPGLPLAVALPAAEFALVESQARRCSFMAGLCTVAGIANARAIGTRAEEWREGIGTNDVVLARALAPPPVVVEYAAPLLRVGGALVEWRGRRDASAERSGQAAARRLGMELAEVRRVSPYGEALDHHLHVYVKSRQTPPGFPRRPGIARKRPLSR
ncbi:MAG TPA: 16S rRNA (guanine(527)-N(7))-methyltransferase RsmG [Solirubrobacteraceae bacterium]|nr:16S rRNA (guanine(527)-N(7))-methyltransferase RsmG [Solirubrobacteraceae bacterium]